MSVRNSGNNGWRTSNDTPAIGSVCGWGCIDVDRNTFSSIFGFDNGAAFTAGTNSAIGLNTAADGTTMTAWTGAVVVGSYALTVGTPFFWAIDWNGTSFTWSARNISSNTLYTASGTFASNPTNRYRKFFGSDWGNLWNGRIWNVKAWTRRLSQKEFLVESFYRRVQYPTSIDFHWKMLDNGDQLDYSENNYTPTVVGTLTDGGESGLWVPRRSLVQTIIASGGATIPVFINHYKNQGIM